MSNIVYDAAYVPTSSPIFKLIGKICDYAKNCGNKISIANNIEIVRMNIELLEMARPHINNPEDLERSKKTVEHFKTRFGKLLEMALKIALPWPPKELSPNSRGHWAKKAKEAKKYREVARIAVLEIREVALIDVLENWIRANGAGITLEITFYPPDRRRRDLDNLIASMKPALDGIADALGVDDSRFKLICSMGEELRGCVEILM